ncbi:MAG TPA: hypothetical protein EYO94_05225, partial [Acidobacteria bacterium]|nr:hypothetical protein [Acidobacteriota bacterium]
MMHRYNDIMLFRSCFVVVGVIVAMPLIVFAQNDADREWVVPRTPEGAPDLQGLWTSQTYTPLQRPEIFEGREFLTDEEMASLTSILTAEDVDPLRGARAFSQALNEDAEVRESATVQADPTHYDNSMWLRTENPKTLSSRRTSLVVDPPNGRIPPLIPDAQRRAEVRRAARGTDSYQERPHQERCLMWTHEGPPMLPPPYNDLYQIFQTPGVVVIFPEMANNPPRIVA